MGADGQLPRSRALCGQLTGELVQGSVWVQERTTCETVQQGARPQAVRGPTLGGTQQGFEGPWGQRAALQRLEGRVKDSG